MKIRSLYGHKIIDGVIDHDAEYYKEAMAGVPGAWMMYDKDAWEPVPTETWQDVTAECSEMVTSMDDSNHNSPTCVEIWHGKRDITRFGIPRYRLRKVTLANRLSDPGVCFIVERKV